MRKVCRMGECRTGGLCEWEGKNVAWVSVVLVGKCGKKVSGWVSRRKEEGERVRKVHRMSECGKEVYKVGECGRKASGWVSGWKEQE